MVGFLGTGSRNSPATGSCHPDTTLNSPPHPNGSAACVFPDKSTPNQSTGHQPQSTSDNSHGPLRFFSLPHWTRKVLPASVSARRSLASMPSELGVIRRNPSKLMLDKELPPTPPIQSVADNPNSVETSSPISTDRFAPSPTLLQADAPPTSAETRHTQSTLYFDVYHNPVPRGVNTVSFVTTSPTGIDQCNSTLPLRHTRSTQSFLSHKQADRSMQPLDGADRVRGFSFGQRQSSSRRKDAEPPPTGENNKASPAPQASTKSSQQLLSVPFDSLSLPALQPTSPFHIDFHSDTPASSRQPLQRSASRLTRSHSEKFSRRPSTSNSEAPALPNILLAFDLSQHHSTTADSTFPSHHPPRPALRRPLTADSVRSRTRSFFTLSPQTTSGPSTQTPHFGNALSSLTTSTSANHANNRPRSATNPPLLHRLSINFFASSTASAKPGTVSGSSISASPVSRLRPQLLSSVPSQELKPQHDESPEAFLKRLSALVGKADIAGLLGSSAEAKYVTTLKLYIGKFSFTGDPLDVALRRLLMHIGLPRETQQIDRVIEAFAKRYVECNPDIFMSDDIPYILAFSLIMLHTDAFNKSNKRKMSKVDYQKNTAISGVIPEVLDCFYDNIIFAPFIFIEDPMDPPRPSIDGSLSRPTSTSVPMTPIGGTLLSRPKIDPYYLITNHLLDSLRVNVEQHIPIDNPYCWKGTSGSWNNDELWSAFDQGDTIEITCFEHNRLPSGLFGLNVPSPSLMGTNALPGFLPPQKETWRLKLSKVSVLNRKDEILEGGKKPSSRKWKPFGVALTTSQVLLFRDPSWAATFLSSSDCSNQSTIHCKPDEVLSVKDALAVFDRSYQKYSNTFRLALADGRQILFQASSELEVNQWVSRINYASAFKSAGIRMRPPGMTGREVTLTGVAAAQSYLQDLRVVQQPQPKIRSWGSQSSHIRDTESTDEGTEDAVERLNSEELEALHGITHEPPVVREIEGASQFKATFDQVKAQLAAARCSLGDQSVSSNNVSDADAPFPGHRSSLIADDNPFPQSNRTILLQSTIGDLEDRICVAQPLLETKMHFARNIAVLTPFQRSTRDRLQYAVQNVAKQISQLRLEIARLICYRNILLNDVAAEEQGFKQAATIALSAAMDTIQSRGQCIPEPTTSSDDGSLDVSLPRSSSKVIPGSLEPSIDDSFRSALDFGPDWPTNYTFSVSNVLETSRIMDSPLTEGESSGYPFLEADTSLSESRTAHSMRSSLELSVQGNSTPHSVYEKFYTAQESPEEQAEEWNKTRAAKRVSLVKLPPDIRLSAMFGKTQRNGCNDRMISTVTREDSSFG
ncbi:uncharacterized protein F5891DRAFT_702286 [Suillus fuscotomentosus]|uniref:Uncharacterized protein n=1 Tax=Suillus fuscotomentosus TaxID=1912939 RepID=A0AAD4HFQ2_9AGAM|nr:uncharacterized protein F5891DRAFT_702286 [Suillus fuscotomentosus]KAG1894822.1 hypothetical protein F5891DRAFT_702286 [Suillus fuscotomentosus]